MREKTTRDDDLSDVTYELDTITTIKISLILISAFGGSLCLLVAALSGIGTMAYAPAAAVAVKFLQVGLLLIVGAIALGLAYRWSTSAPSPDR